jgi:hypothetical protein
VAADRVLGLCPISGSLADDPAEVRSMFGLHFQNIFSHYALADCVVAATNAYCRVIPHKVSLGDRDRLDKDFLKEF